MLRNDQANFPRKKLKTKPLKPSSPILPINRLAEFGKVPRKMLDGRLHLAVWLSGGIGGSKQLCTADINLNESKWLTNLGQTVLRSKFD